jgi:hypothetical protein
VWHRATRGREAALVDRGVARRTPDRWLQNLPAMTTDQRIIELEDERDQLRAALDIAKKWLRRFCDSTSDVWRHPGLTPHEIACEALGEVSLAEDH